MADPRHELGRRGEDLAVKFLRKKGYRIVDRNVRTPYGEIDLIARQGETMVFVEVKARSDLSFGRPEEAVGPTKRRRLIRSARHWLAQNGPPDASARFDVVSVLEAGSKTSLEVLPNAFDLGAE